MFGHMSSFANPFRAFDTIQKQQEPKSTKDDVKAKSVPRVPSSTIKTKKGTAKAVPLKTKEERMIDKELRQTQTRDEPIDRDLRRRYKSNEVDQIYQLLTFKMQLDIQKINKQLTLKVCVDIFVTLIVNLTHLLFFVYFVCLICKLQFRNVMMLLQTQSIKQKKFVAKCWNQ